jgi:hypothetical protein
VSQVGNRVCPAPAVRGDPNAALSVNEEQIQAHRYLPERELIAVLAEHAEDVAELLHRIRRNGIRVEMHYVVADAAEFIEALGYLAMRRMPGVRADLVFGASSPDRTVPSASRRSGKPCNQ